MRNLVGAVCVVLGACAQTQPADLAIRGATVVDMIDGSLHFDQTILVKGDRITAVGPVDEVAVPNATVVVDGTNGYVIPGLWDMHVHLFNNLSRRPPNEWYFPLLIANGVTGVREMWTRLDQTQTLDRWRREILAGRLVGPHIAAAGALVDGPASWLPTADTVTSASEARRFVRRAKAAGMDFIKVYSHLSRESYFAIADEARRLGIDVAGHIPLRVSAREAADAGQRSNEHLLQIQEACSSHAEDILEERARFYAGTYSADEEDVLLDRQLALAIDTRDAQACASVLRYLGRRGLWQVPTLVNERRWFLGVNGAVADRRSVYVPAAERRAWTRGYGRYRWESEAQRRRWRSTLNLVGTLAHEGVGILAGTDLGHPFVYPGFSVHDELALLVEAGLTPLEALRAATLSPARYLGRTDDHGAVEAGHLADLVLLNANPLEDIRNTREIRAVVADGRLYRRADLDRLLADAEAHASTGR